METCKVCNHVERGILDKAMKAGTSLALLAKRFELTEDTLSRHRQNHIGEVTFRGGVDPAELLSTLQTNLENAQLAVVAAEGREKLDAMREVRQTTEAVAKLVGAYKVIDSRQLLPFWNKLKAILLDALKPYPEAREAVLIAIETMMAENSDG